MDVTKQDSIDQAVNTAVDQLGGIDILINNAAIFTASPITEIQREDYQQVFDINVSGTLFTLQAVAKKMIEQAKNSNVDAIKFQTYKANTIASKDSPAYWDTTKESIDSQYKLFKKYDKFNEKDYINLHNLCIKNNI